MARAALRCPIPVAVVTSQPNPSLPYCPWSVYPATPLLFKSPSKTATHLMLMSNATNLSCDFGMAAKHFLGCTKGTPGWAGRRIQEPGLWG